MKKIFVLILLLISVNSVFAANWIQYSSKGWYDISSWTRDKNIVTVWFKDLNPGDWEMINNKKVWYRINRMQADCLNRSIQVLDATEYDTNKSVINTYTSEEFTYYENGRYYKTNNWQSVVPDSVGEMKYNLMCKLR